MANAERNGRTTSVQDAWIAIAAIVNEMTVVTRNIIDFAVLQVPVENPWSSAT